MKKIFVTITMLALICTFATMAWADAATKDEVIQKCSEAAKLIKDKGVEAGIKAIGDPKGAFVWKDSYVVLMDMDGKVLAHPIMPELTKRDDLLKTNNSDGTNPFVEFIKLANEKGSGWVDYMWPKKGEEKPVAKSSYVQRVPGTQYLVSAGIYK